MMTRRFPRLLAVLCCVALVAACGGDGPSDDVAQSDGSAGEGTTTFPVTVTNCDSELTFDSPPQRVLILGRADIFQILYDLEVTDTIVARAGAFPAGYFSDAAAATIEAVPSLGDDLDETGHLLLSREAIIDANADLVIGLPDGVDRASLDAAGIPVLRQPANCPQGAGDASYDDIYDEVEMYGKIFDRADRAAEVADDLRARVKAVEEAAADVGAGRDIAVLFPTVGGGTTYAYGNLSMSHELVTTAGFTNVFGDVDERLFEVGVEELIDRDPDALILLHSDGEPGPVEDAIANLPGAEAITAVRDDAILTQLFSFGEFASPLLVDGLERIVDVFGAQP